MSARCPELKAATLFPSTPEFMAPKLEVVSVPAIEIAALVAILFQFMLFMLPVTRLVARLVLTVCTPVITVRVATFKTGLLTTPVTVLVSP